MGLRIVEVEKKWRTIKIPIDLCFYVVKNRLYTAFQIYIYLKEYSSGNTKLNAQDFKKIAAELNIKSEKTIKKNIEKLINIGWVGYNTQSGYYFFRGFDYLRIKHGFRRKQAPLFDIREIKKIRGFIAASVIGYLIIIQEGKLRAAQKNGCAKSTPSYYPSGFYPVSCTSLQKYFNISLSTAFELKKVARIEGYIRVKSSITKTGLPSVQKRLYQKVHPEFSHKVIIRQNEVCIQNPDLIAHGIIFKRLKGILPKHI